MGFSNFLASSSLLSIKYRLLLLLIIERSIVSVDLRKWESGVAREYEIKWIRGVFGTNEILISEGFKKLSFIYFCLFIHFPFRNPRKSYIIL